MLHPHNATAAEAHTTSCRALAERLSKRVRDGEVECGICLEKVLGKKEMSARRFGLMACNHAFCLGCIRNWRAASEIQADVTTAIRTCPICRTSTHFVTPSTRWPETSEEKEAIIAAYKAAMAAKDCSNFNYGEGTCPFGASCFYRHAYRDGGLEEAPQLRKAGTADGGVKVLGPVLLSSFFEASVTAHRAFNRRPAPQQRQHPRLRTAVVRRSSSGSGSRSAGTVAVVAPPAAAGTIDSSSLSSSRQPVNAELLVESNGRQQQQCEKQCESLPADDQTK